MTFRKENVVEKIINSKSGAFLMLCFCFISGVGIFSYSDIEKNILFYLFVVFWCLVFAIAIFWKNINSRFLFFCVLFFVLGAIRFFISVPSGDAKNILYYNGERGKIIGWVVGEPDIRPDSVKYIIKTEFIYDLEASSNKKVSGRALVEGLLYPRYEYGDKLKISCDLKSPRNSPDGNFRYDRYLAKDGIWSICVNAKIEKIGADEGNFVLKNILRLKTRINEQIEKLWPEPDSGLLSGLLYGARSGIPDDLKENFNRAGISHIVAVSGYNINIIAAAFMIFLVSAGLYRRQAFWLAIFGICVFVIFTGASASVMRAGIMGVVLLIAERLGRLSRVGYVLALAAALMLLFNPYVLVWDAGFQLSFLATAGIVYLSPFLGGKNKSSLFKQILAPTFSAIIATLPLILFQFGRLSAIAPVANVLILWIVPYLMFFGFLAVVLSFVWFPFGQVVAWIVGIGLNYVIMIAEKIGGWNLSAMDFFLPWWGMVAIYGFIVWVVNKLLYVKN
ncbi:MAG: ComEC/Rec2 family competence protein [Patescibacteria group bacterium]|nr:ComEC/Rec2 family competence protein [Patescibacteria group bacterium]